jgi:trehalose/maltose hydrolase-like predicted phosphorylase
MISLRCGNVESASKIVEYRSEYGLQDGTLKREISWKAAGDAASIPSP